MLGMNDVLPKPFTKEGLLQMLEKHLVHLKKPGSQVEPMVAPQPLATTRQVLKEEESPAKSPATTSNWNSPNQVPGVSPVGSDEYMQAVQGHPGAYGVNPMQQNMGYGASQQLQMQQRQQQQAAGHRRQLSDISGGDDMNNPAKRQQQMYGGPMQQHLNPMQRPR
ncbi:kinase-regulated stress-responsive transcription factor skn7 [Coelomomyces lativittatus]|nr:kinase-regulated stress-responsive transcription factor skn7 [Coelomomyces lativittatus]